MVRMPSRPIERSAILGQAAASGIDNHGLVFLGRHQLGNGWQRHDHHGQYRLRGLRDHQPLGGGVLHGVLHERSSDRSGRWFTGSRHSPGNQPPSVSLTSPASGASFAAPATITLNATATDPDGCSGSGGVLLGIGPPRLRLLEPIQLDGERGAGEHVLVHRCRPRCRGCDDRVERARRLGDQRGGPD